MKRVITLFSAVAIITALSSLPVKSDPPDSEEPKRLTPLMQLKLERAKEILEGLALEDFDKIASNARSMKLLSLESGWNVIQTEEYAIQSRDFKRTCDLISEAADEKDMGRAALGYVALTVRCVECHAYMRKHRNQGENNDAEPKTK